MLRTNVAVHETFPGLRAFIPSNPVKKETVPCYAASERPAEMGVAPALEAAGRFPAGRFA